MDNVTETQDPTNEARLSRNQVVFQTKIAVFVDGQNIYQYLRSKSGYRINYQKMLSFFRKWGYVVGAYLYEVDYPFNQNGYEGESQILREKRSKRRKFLDWLKTTGFRVKIKKAKERTSIKEGEQISVYKANCDVEMATDIAFLVASGMVDEIILMTGDGDFAYIAKKARERGVRVTIIGPHDMTAWELKKECDEFIYFDGVAHNFLEEKKVYYQNQNESSEGVSEVSDGNEEN